MPATVQPVTDTTDGDGASASVLLVHGTPARLWNPAIAGAVSAATRREAAGGQGAVVAPMHGTVIKLLVSEGESVSAGDPVAVLEAMKMETHVAAMASGTVEAVKVQAGDVVESGQVVAVIG
jgi:biotin carboxyl carrier protein